MMISFAMIRTLVMRIRIEEKKPFSPNYLWAKPGWERLQNKGIIALGVNLTKRLVV